MEQRQQQQQQQQRWLPLEANPEVLGAYLLDLGGPQLPGGGDEHPEPTALLQFEDLVALEPWAFDMLECRDTAALLLLFPITDRDAEERICEPLPEEQRTLDEELRQSVWFVKQTVPNACGTVALLHCTANLSREKYPLQPGGFLENFFRDTLPNDAAGRGADLEASRELGSLHVAHQEEGETEAAAAADTDTHFTCLLPWKGFVLELDGRKPKPILRAKIEPGQTFREVAVEVIRKHFVEPRGEDMKFSVLAVGDSRSALS